MAISPTDIRILFTNYDIITNFLNLASCSEHFISIKHRILATFNINKEKINSDSLYAFNIYVLSISQVTRDPFALSQFIFVPFTSFTTVTGLGQWPWITRLVLHVEQSIRIHLEHMSSLLAFVESVLLIFSFMCL